jgi:hypothetical protein
VQEAASFAIGRFEIVEEALDGSPLPPRSRTPAAPAALPAPRPIVPIELDFCHGCNCFVRDTETRCPFCHGDLAALHAEHDAWREHIQQVMNDLRTTLLGTTPAETYTCAGVKEDVRPSTAEDAASPASTPFQCARCPRTRLFNAR